MSKFHHFIYTYIDLCIHTYCRNHIYSTSYNVQESTELCSSSWKWGALSETGIRSLERTSSDFTSACRALEWAAITSLWKSGPFWESLKTGEKHSRSLEEKKDINIYDQKTPQPTQSTYGQTTDLQFQTTFPPKSSAYYLIWSSLRESPKPSQLQKGQAVLWAPLSTEGLCKMLTN